MELQETFVRCVIEISVFAHAECIQSFGVHSSGTMVYPRDLVQVLEEDGKQILTTGIVVDF